jgi:hypothetical protein
MTEENRSVQLKSINDILKYNFTIPSYQRGYRWDKTQVIDLLDDIDEFINLRDKRSTSVGDFYCLQPLIVAGESENSFRLVDGQQRLTTIYIILTYLEKRKYSIEFETRPKSKAFLEKISDKVNTENIDFYHISLALTYIKEWFEEREKSEPTIKEEFYINLGKNTKVLWYEIGKDEIERDVFTRINSGKIPLTNAELIKALFLNSKNFADADKGLKQIEIAKEWDEMEYTLQQDEFWGFLTTKKEYATRIELLFEIYSKVQGGDESATYRHFANEESIVDLWSKKKHNIKKLFLSLKYWFNERELYHLIGFLVSVEDSSLTQIYHDFKTMKKSEFWNYLKIKCFEIVDVNNLDNLEYGRNNMAIENALLLFNIATIMNNKDSYIKFAFDKYSNEKWSLEHIHAQQDKAFRSSEGIKLWLGQVQDQLMKLPKVAKEREKEKLKLIDRLKTYSKEDKLNYIDTEFQEILTVVFSFFGDGKADVDSIDNMALLSQSVNSSLSNHIFPIKREILKQKDKQGEFIPICSKNVFLKYYTKDVRDLHFWSANDRKDYLKEIKSTLNTF